MQEREMQYIALAPIEPLVIGQEFEKIPAHMTVIGWFALHALYHESALPGVLRDVFESKSWYQSTIGVSKEYFGTEEQIRAKEIPVTRLDNVEVDPWRRLHTFITLNGTLLPEGSEFNDIFSPHISDTDTYALPVGEKVSFSQIAVISKEIGAPRRIRTVEDVIAIKKSDGND